MRSRTDVSRLILLGVAASILMSPLLYRNASAQDREREATGDVGASASEAAVTTGDGLPDLQPIMDRLENIRRLRFSKKVPASLQDLATFRDEMIAELDELLPLEKRTGIIQGLLRLGLLDREVDLEEELVTLAMTQVLGYYNTDTASFHYLPLAVDEIEAVAAHELVHALQDQNFDLAALDEVHDELMNGDVRNDDRVLAHGYVIEGEATYVEDLYIRQVDGDTGFDGRPTAERMYYKSAAQIEDSMSMMLSRLHLDEVDDALLEGLYLETLKAAAEMPPYFLAPLQSQYTYGAYFIVCVYQHGGWPAVSALYDDLPRSTEQVLHPERYLDKVDEPTMIPLIEIAPLTAAGWTRSDAASHGEYYMRLLLELNGCSRFIAEAAAAGWDGDLYQAFRNEAGHTLITLTTTWDSEAEAGEFFRAYRTSFAGKYPEVTSLASSSATTAEFDTGDAARGWVRLVHRGREVIAVEGGPRELTATVEAALLAQPIPHN